MTHYKIALHPGAVTDLFFCMKIKYWMSIKTGYRCLFI